MSITLDTSLASLPGIGSVRAAKLAKLGLVTAGDLLYHLPQRYEDRRECCTIQGAPRGRPCCITAMVKAKPTSAMLRKGMDLVKVRAFDDTGSLNITYFNQLWMKDLQPGESYVFFGTVEDYKGSPSMTNPVTEPENAQKATRCILPVYPLTAGIGNNLICSLTQKALPCAEDLEEFLPEEVRQAHGLCGIAFARKNIHWPQEWEQLEIARRRLVFEELFTLTCGMALLKGRRTQGTGRKVESKVEDFLPLLPFAPTNAQRKAMEDIARDMASGRSMNRLVQGDVGSGKTAVAAFAAWAVIQRGHQAAMMAPTELLAEQHANTLDRLLSPAGIHVVLLTGTVKGKARRQALENIALGQADLIVGTHALFSQDVVYRDLALVIADEQHRFGVTQRGALAAKGGALPPHVLVMSATPIPRTLALIIYGDLDVSLIRELPPGRTPVATFTVGEDKRSRMYGFIRKQVELGRQVYVVCPSVDESEPLPQWADVPPDDQNLKAATLHAKELQEQVFPDLRVGLVHGKMKPADKEKAMASFSQGELDVLVSTTVIEVGVDVPNASLMIVENAERFGLSQLHQLRGRVGRGTHESFCVLVSASKSASARQRLKVLCTTNDGFEIAEEDLRLRGPGDFFGHRQHGLPQMKVADFASDEELMEQAKEAAEELVSRDPELKDPEHAGLKKQIRRMFVDNADLFN